MDCEVQTLHLLINNNTLCSSHSLQEERELDCFVPSMLNSAWHREVLPEWGLTSLRAPVPSNFTDRQPHSLGWEGLWAPLAGEDPEVPWGLVASSR